jgi:serine/threonine protein kinase
LKPENILLKSKAEDADLMLADFGVSRRRRRRHWSWTSAERR